MEGGLVDGQQHPMIAGLRAERAAGRLGRRDFLRLAALLGVALPTRPVMAGNAAPAQRSGGRLKLGGRVHPLGDPHALAWLAPANVVHQVCEPLTRTGFDNITRPHLLRGWQVSPDLRTWELQLREDVRWHSGRRFVSDDVEWNLRRILDPATGSSAVGLMGDYMLADKPAPEAAAGLWDAAAIEQLDAFRIRLNLKRPQVAVPEHLAHYSNVMLDPEEGGSFGVGSGGTGPFRLVDQGVGEHALLHAAEGDGARPALLDELLLVDLGNEPTASSAAVVSGQVDGLVRCDYSVAEALKGRPGLEVHRTRTAATGLLQMRVDAAPFDDVRVRRALRLAVDVEEVTRVALRGAGIRCRLEVLPAARFWEVWDKAPLAFVEWAPRSLGFMLLDLTMRSGVPWNTTGFSDPEVDALLTRVGGLVGNEARRLLMRRLEARMQEIGPVVQPSWLSVVTVMSQRVGGFHLHPTTLLRAEDYFLRS